MNELLEALENAPNIKKLTYDVLKKRWTIQYFKKAAPTNDVSSDVLIEVIENI